MIIHDAQTMDEAEDKNTTQHQSTNSSDVGAKEGRGGGWRVKKKSEGIYNINLSRQHLRVEQGANRQGPILRVVLVIAGSAYADSVSFILYRCEQKGTCVGRCL